MKHTAQTTQRNPIAPNADGSKRGALVPISPDDPKDTQAAADALRSFESFNEYLGSICDSVFHSEYSDRISRRKKTVQLRNYICGNYLGYVDDRGVWQDKSSKKGADSLYYDPATATYIAVLVASLVKSKPVLNVVAKNTENIEKREAAKVGQLLFDEAMPAIAPAKKLQREVALNFIAAGEAYRYTYFNPEKPNKGYYESVYEPKISQKDKSYGYCLGCNTSLNGDAENQVAQPSPFTHENLPSSKEFPELEIAKLEPKPGDSSATCPHCGSRDVKTFNRKSVVLNVKQGEKFVNVGDIESDFVDPLEMTVIGGTDNIADAMAVQRNRMMFRCQLKEAFGDKWELPSTGTPDELRWSNQQGESEAGADDDSSGNGTGTASGTQNQFEKLHFQETWLHPASYSAYKFDKNTVLKNGKFIKKDTRLTKIFPVGLCVSRIGKRVVNLYAQHAGECWTHSVNSVGEGFHGIGEWDLNALQKQLNDVSSMKMNSLMHDSTNPLIIRSKYVTAAQLKNKVGLVVPISEDFPDERNLAEVATRLPGGNGVPEAYQLANDLELKMVNRTGAMTQQGGGIGEAEAATKTATGYRLWYEHTLGRRAPMLTLRAEMISEQGYQILEMKQKYLCEKMFEFAESEASGDAVKWFMNCNIRKDLNIEIAPDSWMPQSEIQKKADFVEFMQIIGPFAGAKPELIDKIIERISENYQDFDLTDFHDDTTEGQIRLEKLIEVAEFAESQSKQRGMPVISEETAEDGMTTSLVPNPMLVDLVLKQTARDLKIINARNRDAYSDFPLHVLFDDHNSLEKSYTDYLKTATGRRQSLFVRSVIDRMAILHRKAQFEFQRQMSEMALAAQAPEMQAQQMMSAAQHEQGMQQDAEMAEQQLQQQQKAQVEGGVLNGVQEAIATDVEQDDDEE